MSATSDKRSEEFLKISGQFNLGALVTEASHAVTANLSGVARRDIGEALGLLFEVDDDVVAKYREFAESGRAGDIKESLVKSLKRGGRIFFTGCGSTGRLSIQLAAIWRDFWQRQRARGLKCSPAPEDWENRALSVMAGGDFALIKSVEGFEDFAAFGKKQIGDCGVSGKDTVFAITEGGETSFVIGTAWQSVDAGARVYFVYNNPDEILRQHVQRSREVLEDPRIQKLNLTTGPMAIMGSTRMQATTIQLCVMLTVLEMVLRDLMRELEPEGPCALDSAVVPAEFLRKLAEMQATLQSPEVRSPLAELVSLEEFVYRTGHKNNYYAERFALDVLTDTTERSPTYCTPPFRKWDDAAAAESWSFLFLPVAETPSAWQQLLKRRPSCVEWDESEIQKLADRDQAVRLHEAMRKISCRELMRFRIGLDGREHRLPGSGDSVVAILGAEEQDSLLSAAGFYRTQLEAAANAGAKTGLIYFGDPDSFGAIAGDFPGFRGRGARTPVPSVSVLVPVPKTDLLLDGVTRVGVKMLLNALSTCTMVRLGRVMGNSMIWVVASNLKLIDRATRYVEKLAGLTYEEANRLLFEVIEYVEPRMKADQVYPPVIGLAVIRARHGLANETAEKRLAAEMWGQG